MNRMRCVIFAACFCARAFNLLLVSWVATSKCFQLSALLVRKSFGICIPITCVPLRNGPDKSRQVLLRQAAENPEVVKNAGTAVAKEVGTSISKTSWFIGTVVGSALATLSGCGAMFGAFSYFSTLGHNVADLKVITNQMDARFDAYNARSDARFEKVYLGTMSITLGVPALLLIGLGVLKEK
uniref:Uncharacterized protein n=1 Tax=Cryptomonas curvata TaxID=233186 RepID=A0A7S0MYF3_9CRYP|mmetsp:Transcript_55535/g.116223  ORF Transcript_55535/g.116223 Transcript_55535/m.116223 type:complete len:183 (+) Transcript_55535:458-1006(+)